MTTSIEARKAERIGRLIREREEMQVTGDHIKSTIETLRQGDVDSYRIAESREALVHSLSTVATALTEHAAAVRVYGYLLDQCACRIAGHWRDCPAYQGGAR